MSSLDLQVLHRVEDWLAKGSRVWLCTVIRTWGSSPRPAGSILAISDQGHWAGSVSGGCLEEDLLVRGGSGQLGTAGPQRIHYGISEADQARFQLPCGGEIELMVEPLAGDADRKGIGDIIERLENRQRVTREIGDHGMRLVDDSALTPGILAEQDRVLHTLGPASRMLLIGAGEVARYVARMAMAADFQVTLCEPRAPFLSGWDEPGVDLVQRLPDDLVRERFSDRYCAVLALAHDPRVDDMGLLAALESEAFFVGAMGSAKTSAARRQRLHELGVENGAMARLHAPIGFDIGSKTPGEIAVSVMAQVIAERYRLLMRPGARR